MPAIVAFAEFIGCCLVISAIYWLRYLRGAPSLLSDDVPVRYALPALTPILVLVLLAMVVTDAQSQGVPHPEYSSPTAVGIALGLGIGLVALVVWLVVEVHRFRARSRL